jgi:predicted transposase/invertase (TIGR01784 family)
MKTLEHKLTNDVLFKMLFVKHPELLKKLVADLLRIKLNSIEAFEIRNPEIPPDTVGGKFCRLDINMTIDSRRISLEVQVGKETYYTDRAAYYLAREYTTAIAEGQDYSELLQTIHISIVDFLLFDCAEYHSEFQLLEVTRRTQLTDKISLHFFELQKLPEDVGAENHLELWLSLFNARTKEELLELSEMGVPEIKETIEAYNIVSTSPEFLERERLRLKASHDEAQALFNVREEEREKWQDVVATLHYAVAEKDSALAEKDSALAEKDSTISEQAALIEKLRARLGK